MEKVGVRELRQRASEILRRVSEGETICVTDRGRPTAVLSPLSPAGLAELERSGRLRRGTGSILDVKPLRLRKGTRPPSELVSEGRGD